VLPDGKNACRRQRLSAVTFIVSQISQWYGAPRINRTPRAQLPQQTPFAFELSNY
jgi:hypothetical protein